MPDTINHCPECGAKLPENPRFCTSCGTPLADAPPQVAAIPSIGQIDTAPRPGPQKQEGNTPVAEGVNLSAGDVVAGKFEIQGLLGQGGMGAVYRATEIVTGNAAALKIISPDRAMSEKETQRLIDEGTTTRRINHPNIVQIYDIGLHDGAPYIAMELIDGKPLHEWRHEQQYARKTVSMKVAANIIREVLDGLAAAHAAGIIHRDLKPENIMLIGEPTETQARVKVVDFGIALTAQSVPSNASGTGLGSQYYMAPEQIRSADNANESADLYAVSKIFYELIVGVIPTGHWQPPSGGRSDVPRGIDALIEKGLSDNRDLRPQSAAQYKDLLDKALSGGTWNWNAGLPEDRKQEIKDAQQDLKAAYIRYAKAMPTWAWIVIGLVIIASIMSDMNTEYYY